MTSEANLPASSSTASTIVLGQVAVQPLVDRALEPGRMLEREGDVVDRRAVGHVLVTLDGVVACLANVARAEPLPKGRHGRRSGHTCANADRDAIAAAARVLADGGLVAFPTETVYGLGADATNGEAVARLYAAKGRPRFNPLIAHVADASAARRARAFRCGAERLAARSGRDR